MAVPKIDVLIAAAESMGINLPPRAVVLLIRDVDLIDGSHPFTNHVSPEHTLQPSYLVFNFFYFI